MIIMELVIEMLCRGIKLGAGRSLRERRDEIPGGGRPDDPHAV